MKWFDKLSAKFGNWLNWTSSSSNVGNTTITAKNSVLNIGSCASSSSESHKKTKTSELEILFIDDDKKNQIVEAVKNAGYPLTSQIKDITNLDDPRVKKANVLFVDIIGVGQKLFLDEQGLGLAVALKDKYPTKMVAVYSSEPGGNRADPKLKKIDAFIEKTAQPYVFIQHIQNWIQTDE